MANSTHKHKVGNIRTGLMLSFLSLIFTLLVLELIFRIVDVRGDYQPAPKSFMLGPPKSSPLPYSYYPNETVRTFYPSNPNNYFSNSNTIDHVYNSAGWRDVEHSLAPPPNTYRILGLGDSYLFGQGVFFDDICLTKLESYLNNKKKNKNIKIEAINTGISGFNTVNERDSLLNRGLSYQPNLVIVHFVLNDVEENVLGQGQKIDFYDGYLSTYTKPDAISDYSYVWSWFRQRYLRYTAGNAYISRCLQRYFSNPAMAASVEYALKDIKLLCDEHNSKLLIVIFPFYYKLSSDYPFLPIHEHVKAHCRKEGIPVLDLLPHYNSYNGPELWVHPLDQHPNQLAHDIAAKAILDFLLDNKTSYKLNFIER